MNLDLTVLENIEAPLSNDYWAGFLGAAAIGIGIIAIT